jgi:hypothetical protein
VSAKIQYDNTAQSLATELFKTYQNYQNSIKQTPTEIQNYEMSDALLTLVMDRFKLGEATIVDVKQAQQSFELGELMFVRLFPDGRQMLQAMQQDGRLQKVPTDTVIMTPTNQTEIVLADLNVLIAEQKNCTIDDLCTFVKGYQSPKDNSTEVKTVAEVKEVPTAPVRAQAAQNEVLTDLDIAKSYRSQADAMYKEAARLRKQADDLDPPKKKATKVSETADA